MAGGGRLGAKQLITLLIEHPPHCSSLSCFYFLLLCTAAAFCVIAWAVQTQTTECTWEHTVGKKLELAKKGEDVSVGSCKHINLQKYTLEAKCKKFSFKMMLK